ncbi:hypothetical protein B0H10DRAFT_500330 [Mycena sp. CBHHK59/15]|nr:hypothetical protein B0H10DRAFT_500330 [Mycena sp. CBHHK59/15]
MPFFENATNFTVTGGTFNNIAGNMNQNETVYTNVSAHSYRRPEEMHNHFYSPYDSRPSRGRSPRHSPRRQRRGHDALGYAEYYDNRGSRFEETYGGREDSWNRSDLQNRLSAHDGVEITGGELNYVGENVNNYYASNRSLGRWTEEPLYSMPVHPETEPVMHDENNVEEILPAHGPSPPVVNEDSNMSDEETASSSPSASDAPADPPPAVTRADPRRPPTTLERMRMAMSGMEIADVENGHAVEVRDITTEEVHSERKQKPLGKIFQRRSKRQS